MKKDMTKGEVLPWSIPSLLVDSEKFFKDFGSEKNEMEILIQVRM
jgi:hypothetical protein